MRKAEKSNVIPRAKLFRGNYIQLTIFWYKLQFRFSKPQTAAWWGNKSLYDFGKGYDQYTKE